MISPNRFGIDAKLLLKGFYLDFVMRKMMITLVIRNHTVKHLNCRKLTFWRSTDFAILKYPWVYNTQLAWKIKWFYNMSRRLPE